jgi:4-amino-4-deoxy-L-arabinose transferase-like glycosyltransferase
MLAGVVSGIFYAVIAAALPFYDKGEPREALAVQAILRGEGAVLTRPDGRHVQSKPPLFHWMAAGAATAVGSAGELAMRLPSVVLAALGVGLTVLVATRERGVAAGLLSAVVLASSFEWLRAATQSRVDMALTFFVVSAVWAWHRGSSEPGRRWSVRAGYVAVAAAVLTKGPVGLVLPLLVTIVDALRRRAPRSLFRLVDTPAVAGMLIVCVSWYVLAWMRGGSEFTTRQLVHENLQRFVGWGTVAHRHAAPYYVVALAGAFMPWTLALPLAVWRSWRRPQQGDAFLIVWIVTVITFYSLAAGKRSTYLLPIFPPLAILTGSALAVALERPPAMLPRALLMFTGATVFAGAVACGFDLATSLVAMLEPLIKGSDRARLPAALAVVHEQRWTIAATLAIVAASLFVVASPRGVPTSRLAAMATIALTFTAGLTAFGTYPVARKLTTRPFAERVAAHLRPGDRLCACGDLDRTLRFYLGTPVPPCSAQEARAMVRRSSAIEADTTDTHGGPRHYRVRPIHDAARTAGPPCATHRRRGVAFEEDQAL